jgi:hypothetical protein
MAGFRRAKKREEQYRTDCHKLRSNNAKAAVREVFMVMIQGMRVCSSSSKCAGHDDSQND